MLKQLPNIYITLPPWLRPKKVVRSTKQELTKDAFLSRKFQLLRKLTYI